MAFMPVHLKNIPPTRLSWCKLQSWMNRSSIVPVVQAITSHSSSNPQVLGEPWRREYRTRLWGDTHVLENTRFSRYKYQFITQTNMRHNNYWMYRNFIIEQDHNNNENTLMLNPWLVVYALRTFLSILRMQRKNWLPHSNLITSGDSALMSTAFVTSLVTNWY